MYLITMLTPQKEVLWMAVQHFSLSYCCILPTPTAFVMNESCHYRSEICHYMCM